MNRRKIIAIMISAAGLLAAVFASTTLWKIGGRNFKTETSRPSFILYNNLYGTPQQFMEGIYAANNRELIDDNRQIRGLIVPHHLVASEDISMGIRALVGQKVKNIILISPDHFGRCPTMLCTTLSDYETFFGHVFASPQIVAGLSASSITTNNQELFKNEHGIYAVTPFVAKYLNGVTVTPVVVSQKDRNSNKKAMLNLIGSQLKEGTVIIVSSDFSHYLNLKKANEMDEATKGVLAGGDLEKVASLNNPGQSDCPSCLWLLGSLAKERGFYHPDFLMHTNSAEILNNKEVDETTSHFTVLWRESAAAN